MVFCLCGGGGDGSRGGGGGIDGSDGDGGIDSSGGNSGAGDSGESIMYRSGWGVGSIVHRSGGSGLYSSG